MHERTRVVEGAREGEGEGTYRKFPPTRTDRIGDRGLLICELLVIHLSKQVPWKEGDV